MSEDWWPKAKTWLAGPWAAGAVAIAMAFTGFLAGWLSDDIKELWLRGKISFGAFTFLLSSLLSVCLVLAHQIAVAHQTELSRSRLDKSLGGLGDSISGLDRAVGGLDESVSDVRALADRIPDYIRSQPPDEFLRGYGALFARAFHGRDSWDEVEGRLRGTLGVIAQLAKLFDGARGTFTANLMVFVPSASAGDWRELIRFQTPPSLDGLQGVLAFKRSLCATVDPTGRVGGTSLLELALPVPSKGHYGESRDVGTGWQVLPGAPMSFAFGTLEHFGDTRGLAEWCEKNGDYTEAVRRQMSDYFSSEDTAISGFLSLPVSRPPEQDLARSGERPSLAVLNVHWDSHATRLRVTTSATVFADAISPLVTLLADDLYGNEHVALAPESRDSADSPESEG